MMNKPIIVTLDESKKIISKTDWDRMDSIKDEQIERAIKDDKESVPELTKEWFKNAQWTSENKEYVPVYLDHSVAEFLKRRGANYHFWLNEILKDLMQLTASYDKNS